MPSRSLRRYISIKTSGVDTPIDNLSGGNQQKVILGRWLGARSRIFLMMAPTAAVDIGAKAEIYSSNFAIEVAAFILPAQSDSMTRRTATT